ncbi:MAG: pseudouridine synthase [Desulfosarcinaceae bacterium]
MALMRLQKWLSTAGVCSRRRGETLIVEGRVRVNGATVRELGTKIDDGKDLVEVDGQPVGRPQAMIYIALNKPEGYVTSCRHPGEKVVVDLIDIPQRIYPIGRLDKDSTGLLLLTNDGRLHHHLSHPSFDHEKEYEVVVDRPISSEALQTMARGLSIGGKLTRPARVQRRSSRKFRIVLQEGRNRQIRRMTAKLGYSVVHLKRIRMAHVRLGGLPPGGWRHLSQSERKKLIRGL